STSYLPPICDEAVALYLNYVSFIRSKKPSSNCSGLNKAERRLALLKELIGRDIRARKQRRLDLHTRIIFLDKAPVEARMRRLPTIKRREFDSDNNLVNWGRTVVRKGSCRLALH